MLQLNKWVELRDGEERLFGLLALHSALFGSSISLFFTAATAIFLAQFDDSALIWNYLTIAVISIVLSAILVQVQRKLPTSFLFRSVVLLLIGAALFFWSGLLVASPAWIVFTLMAWERVQDTLLRVEWLGIQGELLTISQSKRMLGPIGAAEMAGKVTTYIFIPILLQFTSARFLILLTAIAFGLMYLLLELLLRLQNNATETATQTRSRLQPTRAIPQRPIWENKYLWTILGSIGLVTLLKMTLTYGTYTGMQQRFTDEAQLASFVSWFYLTVYCIVLFIRGPLTPILVRRFGVGMGFGLLPFVIVIAGTLSVISGMQLGIDNFLFFASVILVFGAFHVIFTGFYGTSQVLLLQVLHPKEQVQAKIGSEMIMTPVATGLTGLMLLALKQFELTNPLIAIGLASLVAVIMLLLVRSVYKHYHASLSNSFATSKLSGKTVQLTTADELAALRQRLRSPEPVEIRFTVDQLKELQKPLQVADTSVLLSHVDPSIRVLGLQEVGNNKLDQLLNMVNALLTFDQHPNVRKTALDVYCQRQGVSALHLARRYVTDADPLMRQSALLAMFKYGGIEGLQTATQTLNEMLQTSNADQRALLAETIVKSEIPALTNTLFSEMLEEDNVTLRREYYRIIGRTKALQYIPHLLKALNTPIYAGTASQSLVQFGDPIVQPAIQIYEARETDIKTKQRIVSVLSKLNLPAVNQYLFNQLADAESELRRTIYEALALNRYHPTTDVALATLLPRELETGACLTALHACLQKSNATPLLMHSIEQALGDVRTQIALLLGLMRGYKVVNFAKRALDYGGATQQALGMEYFETIIPVEFKDTAMVLFDPELKTQERWEKLQKVFPQFQMDVDKSLRCMLESAELSPWVRACALHMVGESRNLRFTHEVNENQQDTSFVIRQTATQTMQSLRLAMV